MPSPDKSASGSAPGLAQRIPASFFSIVMGLGGLGYAWRAAGRTYPVLAPFGPGYWAFTLPVAALSVAAWRIAHATAAEPALTFALALFLAANALIGCIALRTVTALAQGRFVPLRLR